MSSAAMKEPRQTRSRRSLDRILEATEALLETKDFHAITVAEIAQRAGVAPGLLYSRFRSKDDLLPHLLKKHLVESNAALRAEFDEANWRDKGVRDRLDRLFALLEESVRRKRGLMRATGARQVTDINCLDAEEKALRAERMRLIADWLNRGARYEDAPPPQRAAEFAAFMASLTFQAQVLFDLSMTELTDDDVVRELRSALDSYFKACIRNMGGDAQGREARHEKPR